jgi:DMSO/TMAO reductase YedYZ heme-binding membrane subunit
MTATSHRDAVPRASSSIPAFCATAAIGATLVALFGYSMGAAPDERWLLAARYTARLSFPIFVLVFVSSSWNRLAPIRVSRFLVRRRRALGLAFATAHTIHLGALVTANVVAGKRPDAVTLLVGGGAYLVMFAMVATSTDAAVRRLGRNWLRLHKLGIYWLWFVFTFSYAGRTFGNQPEFAPFFGLALAALALRIAAARVRRPHRDEASALASANG